MCVDIDRSIDRYKPFSRTHTLLRFKESIPAYIYPYICVCVCVNIDRSIDRYKPLSHTHTLLLFTEGIEARAAPGTAAGKLAFTRYCHHQYCMVYGIERKSR